MDQHAHKHLNPHAPVSSSYPSIQEEKYQEKAKELIQSIFDKLNMKFGAFNFEYILDESGEVYILEIGPRNGGNAIPDTIRHATGIDMIEASIKACMGDPYEEALVRKKDGIAGSYMIHSEVTGKYDTLEIDPEVEKHIVKKEVCVKPGDEVHRFHNGGDSIGTVVMEFDTVEDMDEKIDNMWKYMKVHVKE